jgi:hypothetical protein
MISWLQLKLALVTLPRLLLLPEITMAMRSRPSEIRLSLSGELFGGGCEWHSDDLVFARKLTDRIWGKAGLEEKLRGGPTLLLSTASVN